jgi:hypothetical protein
MSFEADYGSRSHSREAVSVDDIYHTGWKTRLSRQRGEEQW